jgi:hypothetical protein
LTDKCHHRMEVAPGFSPSAISRTDVPPPALEPGWIIPFRVVSFCEDPRAHIYAEGQHGCVCPRSSVPHPAHHQGGPAEATPKAGRDGSRGGWRGRDCLSPRPSGRTLAGAPQSDGRTIEFGVTARGDRGCHRHRARLCWSVVCRYGELAGLPRRCRHGQQRALPAREPGGPKPGPHQHDVPIRFAARSILHHEHRQYRDRATVRTVGREDRSR